MGAPIVWNKTLDAFLIQARTVDKMSWGKISEKMLISRTVIMHRAFQLGITAKPLMELVRATTPAPVVPVEELAARARKKEGEKPMTVGQTSWELINKGTTLEGEAYPDPFVEDRRYG